MAYMQALICPTENDPSPSAAAAAESPTHWRLPSEAEVLFLTCADFSSSASAFLNNSPPTRHCQLGDLSLDSVTGFRPGQLFAISAIQRATFAVLLELVCLD